MVKNSIAGNSSWTTVVYDRELNFIDVSNPSPQLLFGLDINAITGKNLSGLSAMVDDENSGQASEFSDNVKKAFDSKRNRLFLYDSITAGGCARVVSQLEVAADGTIVQYLTHVQEEGDDQCNRIHMPRSGFSGADLVQEMLRSNKYEELYIQNLTIIESLPVGVEIYSADGILQFMNKRDCEIFQVDRKSVLSAEINLFDNPNLPDDVKNAVRKKIKVISNFDYHFSIVEQTGYYKTEQTGVRRIECSGTPVLNARGEFENYVFIVNDRTEFYNQSQALKQTRSNLQEAMQIGKISVWEINLEKNVFSVIYSDRLSEGMEYPLDLVASYIHDDDRETYLGIIKSFSEGARKHDKAIVRFMDKDGSVMYFDVSFGARRNSAGVITHVTGIQRDITESSVDRQESDDIIARLGQAIDDAKLISWSYDIRTKATTMINGASTQTGIDEVHPNDRDAFMAHFECVLDGEKQKDTILTRIRLSDSDFYRCFESTVSSINDSEGNVVSVVGSLKDINNLITAETELKKQKDFVALALEAGGLSAYIYDVRRQMFDSLEGQTLSDDGLTMERNLEIMHPADVEKFSADFEAIIAGETQKINMHLRYRDDGTPGGYRHFESSVIPVVDESGIVTHLIGSQKDVTENYFAELELRRSKQKADLSIKDAGSVLWEYDCEMKEFTCYNEWLNNYDESIKLLADDYARVAHPDDLANVALHVELMNQGRDESFTFDYRMHLPEGDKWQFCVITGTPFEKDSEGRVVRYVGIRKDNTTHQKRMEFLNNILNSIPIPIYIKNRNHEIIFANRECRKLYIGEESTNSLNFIEDNQALEMHRIDDNIFETGKPYFEKENITLLNGKQFETIVSKNLIFDDDDKLLLCVRWDESQQNELRRKSQILSISTAAMRAYTWYYSEVDNLFVFGDGFEKTGGRAEDLNTIEKHAARVHPDDRAEFLGIIDRIRSSQGGDFSFEHRIDLAGTGNYEWWEARGCYETINAKGVQSKFIYGMDFNIEKHKQSELALLNHKREMAKLNRQNELILNNTNSGLAYISTDYKVQWENMAICSASISYEAYKKGEYCYKSAHGRTSPCENCVMRRAMLSKQTESISFDFENGKTIEVFATPVVREDGEVDGVVIRVDDVTQRKKMINQLEHARLQAEQSDKLKSAFLANMSHEIRTPLNAIVGFSDLMMTSDDQQEKEEYGRYIKSNNEVLLKLINDILDLSKIEAGAIELKYEKFDLAEYFDDIAASMQCRVTNPDIKFVCTNPYEYCSIELDKGRLTQIITNYVTNSVKYTAGGFIEMGYEYTGDALRVYVKDSGIGIDDDKRDKVFHRFEKLDEFAQGTGLGLSICKAIVERFGGSVGFESKKDVGSEFWALIPCRAEINRKVDNKDKTKDNNNMVTEINAATSTSKRKILVAEDISSNYLLINAILKRDYDLTHALNGLEAVDQVKAQKFDLVLMDMKMPEMGGLEATAKIREFDKEIPIIALTAHAFESDRVAAIESGCNDYLVKPLDKALLLATLDKYIK